MLVDQEYGNDYYGLRKEGYGYIMSASAAAEVFQYKTDLQELY